MIRLQFIIIVWLTITGMPQLWAFDNNCKPDSIRSPFFILEADNTHQFHKNEATCYKVNCISSHVVDQTILKSNHFFLNDSSDQSEDDMNPHKESVIRQKDLPTVELDQLKLHLPPFPKYSNEVDKASFKIKIFKK